MRLGKFKINHYINYMVVGLITLVMGTVSLVGGRFDNSLLFLMEKIAISRGRGSPPSLRGQPPR